MKLNPIYKKELKTSVRNNRLYSIIFVYNAMLALFTLLTFLIVFRNDIRGNAVEYGIILKVYGIISSIEFGLLIFIIPGLSASTISHEAERQTLELLLATTLRPIHVVLGKLMSSVSLMILLAVSSLPILSLVFIIGGISVIELIEFMLMIIVTGIYIGSIGIFFSSIYKRTVIATITSYGTVFILIFGTILSVWITSMMGNGGTENIVDGYRFNDTGNLVLILLINPAITCLSMIVKQIGNNNLIYNILYNLGQPSVGIVKNWFVISLIVQIGLASIFISLSCFTLRSYSKK